MPGVYLIQNTVNWKCYIGSTVQKRFDDRWKNHRYHLRKGTHANTHLQSSWSKHGEAAFRFLEIEITSREDAVPSEQWWLDFFKPVYNQAKTAGLGSRTGCTVSDGQRQKISLAHKGKPKKPFTIEHRRAMSLAQLGRIPWNKGIPWSERVKASLRGPRPNAKPWNKGLKFPQPVRLCDESGCGRKHLGRGLCSLHFQREKKKTKKEDKNHG